MELAPLAALYYNMDEPNELPLGPGQQFPAEETQLDPPFLKDDRNPVSLADAAALESAEARAHGGHVPKGGFAAAAQKAAAANLQAGFLPQPTTKEMLATVMQMGPAAEELPSLAEAAAVQSVEQDLLGSNPRGGLASKMLSAATKADAAMKKSIEAGALTEEAAALLQSAESKLFGQVLPGGVASQVVSYARQNREAGLCPEYHPRHGRRRRPQQGEQEGQQPMES